jgi:hypothetical protein
MENGREKIIRKRKSYTMWADMLAKFIGGCNTEMDRVDVVFKTMDDHSMFGSNMAATNAKESLELLRKDVGIPNGGK